MPFRASFPNTDAAPGPAAGRGGVAANGHRLAGALAALSAAVWFDFFLTRPYEQLRITRRDDIETTVLLLVIGIAGRGGRTSEDGGLPGDTDTELLVESSGVLQGRFLMTPAAPAQSIRGQRLVAIAFADQVGAALAGSQPAGR